MLLVTLLSSHNKIGCTHPDESKKKNRPASVLIYQTDELAIIRQQMDVRKTEVFSPEVEIGKLLGQSVAAIAHSMTKSSDAFYLFR